MPVFTPPTDHIVPPIYLGGPDPLHGIDSAMQRLFRHFDNRDRGRNIFLMSDGTVTDSQDTSFGANASGTPPNMIQPPTDPYVRSIFESGGELIEVDVFQVPYVVRTYYGGSGNVITSAEATILTAAGYGAFIH